MFTQKMKGVFKSISRPDSNSKIPESLERATKLECSSLESAKTNANYLNSEVPNVDSISCKANATSGNSYFRRRMSLRQDRQNKRDQMTATQNESFWKLKAHSPRPNLRDGFGGLSASDDLRKEEKNINDSCHFCHSDSDINRITGGMIYDQESQLKKSRLQKLNLNNDGYNTVAWNPKPRSCEFTMCHYCLKQFCVCGNSKLVPKNNNNYLSKPLHHSSTENTSSFFSPVLQHAFGEERSHRNDFIILGLGIHQYMKEVFNALDSDNKGYVHYEDLQILCRILGKDLRNNNLNIKCEEEELNSANVCVSNSCEVHLHFGKFAEIINKTFSNVTDGNSFEKRKNTQLVNATVNVTRRSESLNMISKQLEELESDYLRYKRYSGGSLDSQGSKEKLPNFKSKTKDKSSKDISYESNNNSSLENLKLQKIVLLQQQELQCLREVIEDLRISLQCSDAENLNLRVQEVKKQTAQTANSLPESSKNSFSSDDEKDSIDRLILNFPSSESVKMDSIGSLLSMESLNLSAHSNSPTLSESHEVVAEHKTKVQRTERLQRESDCPSLEDEIQNAYQTLSNTRMELEDTRQDLENTVSQIRNKNSEIDMLNKRLRDTACDLEKSITTNKNLKDTIVALKHDAQDKGRKMKLRENDLENLTSKCTQKDNEVVRLSEELQKLQMQRRIDLRQFSATRDIIYKSLVQAKKNENSMRELLKNDGKNDIENQEKDLAQISDNYSSRHREIALESEHKRNINCDKNNNEKFAYTKSNLIGNSKNNEKFAYTKPNLIGDSKNNEKFACTKFNLIGDSNNCQEGIPRVCADDGSNCNVRYDKSNVDNCKGNTEQENRLSQKMPNPTSFERRSEFESSTDLCSSVKLVAGESTVRRNESLNIFPPTNIGSFKRDTPTGRVSSHIEDKPTMEVKPNLTTPIAVMRHLFSKPPPYQSTESFRSESLKRSNVYGQTKEKILSEKPIFNEIRNNEKEIAKDFKIDVRKCSSKDISKSSTQILEGLEAEVDFLRKCLEEDQLLG